jgi:hypothetical protein
MIARNSELQIKKAILGEKELKNDKAEPIKAHQLQKPSHAQNE